MQIMQMSETDVLALNLGRLILQGVSAASKLDQTSIELLQIKTELEKLKEDLPSVKKATAKK